MNLKILIFLPNNKYIDKIKDFERIKLLMKYNDKYQSF